MRMLARRRLDKTMLWVLVGGFTLTIAFLLGSAYLGIQAMDAIGRGNAALLERHRDVTHGIDEMQGEEAGLNGIFYALVADPKAVDRAALLAKLDTIETNARRTIGHGLAGPNAERWQGVHAAVDRFIAEVRRLLETPDLYEPPVALYRAHEALTTQLSTLVAGNDEAMVRDVTAAVRHGREPIRQALVLLGIALLLSIGCAIATVGVALRVFHRIEWQAAELARLSTHVLETQEQILQRFSRELHDELGQTLTAIEANLVALPAGTSDEALRREDALLLVKDAIGNVRELSQLLRPSTLDDFGLASSLQWLSQSFAQRTRIEVEQRLDFEGRLHGDIETHLFRIAQEALTNVARHSGATRAGITLAAQDGTVRLSVTDNGRGLPPGRSPRAGFGLIGMRERMRAAGGMLDIASGRAGVTVTAEVPVTVAAHGVQQV